jgi:hypothetical protein
LLSHWEHFVDRLLLTHVVTLVWNVDHGNG